MGKKKSSHAAATKAPNKQEKKQQSHTSLMKILRPKVYITDSSNFKTLVQELTGNGSSPVSSPSPPPRINSAASPPPPFADHAYGHDASFDSSSCFSSPDLSPPLEYGFDFSAQIRDLEALLMGIDSMNYSNAYDSCSAPIQQEVCAYDYDFSSLI